MSSTWKKVITGLTLVAAVSSHVGFASAGRSCSRRKPAAPVVTRVAAAPVTAARVTAAPVAVTLDTAAPVAVAPVAVATETVAPSVVDPKGADQGAVAAPVDLELSDLRLVDNGNDEQGPAYRVIVKNLSRTAVTSEITVALLASMEKDSDDNLSALGSLESLEGGATKSVDLRLPKGAEVLTYLTAAVGLSEGNEANETDNVAIFERDSVVKTR